MMQAVLSKLPNVSEHHFTCTGLPVSCLAYNPAYLLSIFRSASIRHLTITISLENLSALDAQVFSNYPPSNNSEWFYIAKCPPPAARTLRRTQTLTRTRSSPQTWPHTQPPFSSSSFTLATAINYVRHTLKSLEIEIRGPCPLGSFLPLIDHLPHLEQLIVTLPIDGNIQFDNHHSALSTFIDRHSATLRAEQPIFSSLGRRGGEPLLKAAYTDDNDDGDRIRGSSSRCGTSGRRAFDPWI